jgi:DNA repair protein RecN (Recombination protein N)
MITYLKVRNLAIVEQFEIEPGSGLNVLTGETGAGKSLLIDSVEFLSGARGSSEAVRTGTERMTAEAIVAIPKKSRALFEDAGIELDEPEIVVRREFSANGRSRVSVNGSLLTVRELQELMGPLVEIHGQNYSHQRIAGQTFREVLDAFGDLGELTDRTRLAWSAWKQASEELSTLEEAQKDRALRLDLLRYQIEEISAARLEAEEEEGLRAEREILANAQELIQAASASFDLLDEDEDSALTRVGRTLQMLEPLGETVEDVRRIAEELADIRYRLEEASRALTRFGESVRHDPERLDEVEERLATIDRLKRKYGANVREVLDHLESITREHDQLADFEASAEKLAVVEKRQFDAYFEVASELSQRRKKAAPKFQKEVERELADLAMDGTTVRVVLATQPASGTSRLEIGGKGVLFGSDGFDDVEILLAPNRGEEPKAMARIASGGELSRIQLAIAAALFKKSKGAGSTLVFDEIDQGVGGRVAEVVGRKLKELSERNQVICVTHLPQIASLADTHFRVWKETVDGRTSARVAKLPDRDARIEEIARMLGGASISPSARSHAAELVAAASHRLPK